jgi:hypothetical protein
MSSCGHDRCNVPPSKMTLALEKSNAWAYCSSSIWHLPRLIVASKLTQMQESGIFHPVPAHPEYWIIETMVLTIFTATK